MALVHNTFIRGLNTIYLQADYIDKSNKKLVKEFFQYCQCWSSLIAVHHEAEEAHLFHTLEDKIPEAKGIFEVNVEQHKAFHDGLHEFEAHSQAGLDGKIEYSATKIKALIDSFIEPLMKHLSDEIPTLMALQKSEKGQKDILHIHEEYEVLVQKDIDKVSCLWNRWFALLPWPMRRADECFDQFKIAPYTLVNTDKTFEKGEHPFPVMSPVVPYLVKYIMARKYSGAWKFGCTDYFGKPTTLWMNGRQKAPPS